MPDVRLRVEGAPGGIGQQQTCSESIPSVSQRKYARLARIGARRSPDGLDEPRPLNLL
jgi:hypothetical protein